MEIWVDLPNYTGYQISNLGKVRTFFKMKYHKKAELGTTWREISTFLKTGKHRYSMFTLHINRKSVAFYVHRVVWELFVGPIPEGYEIDHINGCPWDNRLENLRIANRSQNSCNQKKRANRKFKGVYPYRVNGKVTEKFVAAICVERHQIHLGVFESELLAAKAYNEAARQYHGEYANLNAIEDA